MTKHDTLHFISATHFANQIGAVNEYTIQEHKTEQKDSGFHNEV